jgi:Flp pilus assembly protein TadG
MRLLATRRTSTLVSDERGQAAVEFALILPILMALLLGIIQFGIVFNNYVTITDAARAGARKAAVSRFLSDNGAAAKIVAKNSAQGLDQSKLGVTVSACTAGVCSATAWNVPGSDVVVTTTYPYSIHILGWTVKAGNLTSTTKERLE